MAKTMNSGVAAPDVRKVVESRGRKAAKAAIRAQAEAIGERAAALLLKAQTAPAPTAEYVYADDRGDAYSPDPAVREAAWTAAQGAFLAKSRAATGGVTPGQLNHWLLVARTDPDPGIREAMWRAIYESTGGAA